MLFLQNITRKTIQPQSNTSDIGNFATNVSFISMSFLFVVYVCFQQSFVLADPFQGATVEHKIGSVKPAMPLTEVKKQLDAISLQVSVYKKKQLSEHSIQVLQKHWKWLSKMRNDLETQAEKEPFSIVGSNVRFFRFCSALVLLSSKRTGGGGAD